MASNVQQQHQQQRRQLSATKVQQQHQRQPQQQQQRQQQQGECSKQRLQQQHQLQREQHISKASSTQQQHQQEQLQQQEVELQQQLDRSCSVLLNGRQRFCCNLDALRQSAGRQLHFGSLAALLLLLLLTHGDTVQAEGNVGKSSSAILPPPFPAFFLLSVQPQCKHTQWQLCGELWTRHTLLLLLLLLLLFLGYCFALVATTFTSLIKTLTESETPKQPTTNPTRAAPATCFKPNPHQCAPPSETITRFASANMFLTSLCTSCISQLQRHTNTYVRSHTHTHILYTHTHIHVCVRGQEVAVACWLCRPETHKLQPAKRAMRC